MKGLEKNLKNHSFKRETVEFEIETMKVCEDLLTNQNKWIKDHSWDKEQIEILNRHYFLTSKPVVYLANVAMDEYIAGTENKYLKNITDHVENKLGGGNIIVYSADYENHV